MALSFADCQKDAKVFALLKTYMTAQHNNENYDFLVSRDSNDKLYAKFISAKSSTQVNLKGPTQSGLDKLANEKKFKDMNTLMQAARTEITSMINMDVLPRFEASNEYKTYLASKAPKAPPPAPKAAPKPAAAPAKPALDLTAAKTAVAAMEKNLIDGTTFLTTATATVKSKGKPADKEEVNRMFESGRMRHDRVHEAFTMLLQKDKAFTRENFSAFFAKKEAFSKLWGDYRKLLGR
jgi:hypothetical protein